MHWRDRKEGDPRKNGLYLVYCEAANWDSYWPALMFFRDDKFEPTQGDTYSVDSRVVAWSEITTPPGIEC